ncbi:MAG: hypothetical protein K1X85_13190 [Ignavibacteria bacterium]|nr:hypothetical protein [Ignavibacteria bacterium]
MDFLQSLVLPATTKHLMMVKLILALSMMIFIPFFGMLLGGTAFSVIFNSYGRKNKKPMYVRFAKDIIDKLAINRFVGVGLGIIPLLSIAFCYAQLLYGQTVITVSLLLVATFFLAVAVNFIYSYQNTFQIESLIETFKDISGLDKHELETKVPEEVTDYEFDLLNTNSNAGLWGFVLLIITALFFAGGTSIALNSDRYQDFQNIAQMFLSGSTFINFLFILVFSLAATGVAILFFFFGWQGGMHDMEEEYADFAKNIGGKIAFTGAALLPVFLFLSFFFIPKVALSGSVFVYTGLAFIGILLLCNLIYAVIKNSETKYIGAAFYLLILCVGFIVMKNESAFGIAVEKNLLAVNQKAMEVEAERKSKTVSTSGINGEEIYNKLCVACHKFDVKVVGPPYQQTVPTYNGDVKKLAGFILKPVKKNPEYPPMPAQPLKPKEAEAVALYLIEKVSGKK